MTKYNFHLEKMEYHRRELEKLMAFGSDNFPIGTVLFFEKSYVNRGLNTKFYKYVVLKATDRAQCWYTCGPRSPGPYTWDELVSFMSDTEEIRASHVNNWSSLPNFREEIEEDE